MLLLYFLVDILPLKRIHRREGGWEFNIDKLVDVSIILDTFPPKIHLFPPENLYIIQLSGIIPTFWEEKIRREIIF